MQLWSKPVTQHPANVNFSIRLRAWLDWKNIPVKAIATDLDYSESTIHRWLNCERNIDLCDVERIAKYFGTNPRCMLCNHEDTRCDACKHPKPPPMCKPCQAPRIASPAKRPA